MWRIAPDILHLHRQILKKVIKSFFSNSSLISFCLNHILDVIASLLASLIAFISILLYTGILYLLGKNRILMNLNYIGFWFYVLDNTGQDRVHVLKPGSTNVMPVTTTQAVAPPRLSQNNNHRPTQVGPFRKKEQIDRATSPVDDRILNEFYTSRPKDVHQYTLDGRQYVVYEGADLTDIETYRNGKNKAQVFFFFKIVFYNRINTSNVNTRTTRSS